MSDVPGSCSSGAGWHQLFPLGDPQPLCEWHGRPGYSDEEFKVTTGPGSPILPLNNRKSSRGWLPGCLSTSSPPDPRGLFCWLSWCLVPGHPWWPCPSFLLSTPSSSFFSSSAWLMVGEGNLPKASHQTREGLPGPLWGYPLFGTLGKNLSLPHPPLF